MTNYIFLYKITVSYNYYTQRNFMKKLVAFMFFGLINFETSVNAHINFALCNDENCQHGQNQNGPVIPEGQISSASNLEQKE